MNSKYYRTLNRSKPLISFDTSARKKIGELISSGRKKKKMSQAELAKLLGINCPQQVCNFEKGRALPPRKIMSNLIVLNIIAESKFKALCLQLVKKELQDICKGVS